ncbi:uncharacterized protein [Paramormyrops kingsleyae]|uniref:uncharacterized protein n=1 Tax=Paramormyrops kingsleyae TaxID=1676925 RepID=UPI003B96B664
MESLYEPVKEGDDTQVYSVPSRPCSREVLLDEDTKWHGSAKSASMERSRFHHDSAKKKKAKSLTPKSTLATIDDISCCHNISWQTPKKGEDLVLIRGNQEGEMWKDAPQTEPKIEEKRVGQLTSRRGKKELVVEADHVFGEMANSRGKTKTAHNAPRVKKGGHKSPRKNKSIIENNAHVQACKPMSENLVASCISMAKRPEKKPYTEASEQAQEQPFLALDLWWNTAPPPGQQRWSNPIEGLLPWSASYHTCRRPLTECRVYASDFILPRKDCHWICSAEHPPPRVMRSITDLDLYDSSVEYCFAHILSDLRKWQDGTVSTYSCFKHSLVADQCLVQ